MKKFQLIEFKLFLRSLWIFIFVASIVHVVISDGYIGLKQGFDWSFLQEPRSYFKFAFYIIGWTAFEYFIFWRLNPAFREKMREKLKSQKNS